MGEEKIVKLDNSKLIAIGGPTFMVDILIHWFKSMIRLISIQQQRQNKMITVSSIAHFIRSTFKQSGGLPCSVMLAGYDDIKHSNTYNNVDNKKKINNRKPLRRTERDKSGSEEEEIEGKERTMKYKKRVSLYWFDYLGSLHRTKYAIHGPSAPFLYALLDEQYKKYSRQNSRRRRRRRVGGGGGDAEKGEGEEKEGENNWLSKGNVKNKDDDESENFDIDKSYNPNGIEDLGDDISVDQAVQIVHNCFDELEKRFQLNTNPNRSSDTRRVLHDTNEEDNAKKSHNDD